MIGKSKSRLKRFCRNYTEVENYQEALSSPDRWDLHHRMEIQPDGVLLSTEWMKEHNIYYDLDPCMMIFLPHSVHQRMHLAVKNHLKGKTDDKHPSWKGDEAKHHSKYMRLRRAARKAKEKV